MKSWISGRDAIRSTPGTSLPHLGGRTGRVEDRASIRKGQTKSDQEGKAFGVKSVYTPSTAGKDASSRKMALVALFLSYRWELTIPSSLF